MVYRYFAEGVLNDRKRHFTLRGIARELALSPNTVSLAAMQLAKVGAVTKYNGYFGVTSLEKLLVFWSVVRNLDHDIKYRTYSSLGIAEIEKRMPAEVAYTCYSGYVALFGNDVSDYDKIYVYATESGLKEVMRRFPEMELQGKPGYSNILVLKADPVMEIMIEEHTLRKAAAPLTQIYVDLWNNKDWFAYEFLKKLRQRIEDKYAKAILQ